VSDPKKKPQILFVDDEPDFLQVVIETFSSLSNGDWDLHQATSADAAMELLKHHKIDLAVVDINMPLLDGVQFLRILGRRHPSLKKVTLTAFATEEKRTECLANGAELFIEKPRTAAGFKSIYVMLEELVTWSPQAGFQGMLRQVGLNDVIQMECLGRNSSILEIHNQKMSGRIFIEEGTIIHAILGAETGEKAFQKLLSITGGEFNLLRFESPGVRSMQGPWEFLLMEASRVRDELALQPEPAVAPAAPVRPSVIIVETLICTAQGDPVFLWQCPDAPGRIVLLQNIAQQTALLSKTLPLGNFERLEILQPDHRTVAVFSHDHMVFVRSASAFPPA